MDLLSDLNERQRIAVTAEGRSVLISAGPGTGKTKTLTARIAYLLTEEAISPERIVALTFTNKAAREMGERLRTLLGRDIPLPYVATVHALGLRLLQRQNTTISLVSESERQAVLKAILKSSKLKGMSLRDVSLRLSQAKVAFSVVDPDMRLILEQYNQALQVRGMCDFDDVLLKAYEYLKDGKTHFDHVLVDEFQDTNELQYEMLRLLSGHENLFAIGDPNQSIYAFRGASGDMFNRFIYDFPETQHIALIHNYRSCRNIVTAANAIFPSSPQLIPNVSGPGAVRVVDTYNEYSEAAYVLAEIERGIGGSDLLHVTSENEVHQPKDYAVLYRTHRAATAIRRAFQAAGIPFQIVGEGSPYERADMQAVIAGMRYICHQVRPPIYKDLTESQLCALFDGIQIERSVSDVAGEVAAALGLSQHEHLRQFQSMLVQFGSGLQGLMNALQHIDDISGNDFYDASLNVVSLMTIHAAKGLEFGHVFLIAAEEGILPKETETTEGLAEERRLFYVAITRAKDTLSICHTKVRGGEHASRSRFVEVLPAGTTEYIDDPGMALAERRHKKRAAKRAQISLF
jgi:superfamily I DNA/RNA helicase